MFVVYYIVLRVLYGESGDVMFKAIFHPGTGSFGLGGGFVSGSSSSSGLDLDGLEDLLDF
jgi:hypothetical protein